MKHLKRFESYEVKYECPNCRSCFTAEEWNEENKIFLSSFGFPPLPEAKDDESARFDCPECGEVCMAVDMDEY